jgi:RecB family exonuclease
LSVLDEQVGLADAVGALRETLGGGTVPEGRVGRDGVAVLTPLEARGLRFSTVVFTGLAEGGFPVRGRPDPLLGDVARRRLGSLPGVRLPQAEQRETESALLLAFACEATRDRLVLLAPRTDAATGRPRLPSRYLVRLASLAAGRPVGQDEFLTGRPLAAVWRRAGAGPSFGDGGTWVDERERDAAALLGMSVLGSTSAARDYLSAVLESPPQARRRLGAWHSARSPEAGEWDGLLGGQAQAVLGQCHPFAAEVHPTSLERYITCPFSFFLRDVLELEAPREPGDSLDMDVMEFGNLVHSILETAYARVIAERLDLASALEVVDEAWRARCAEAERAGVTGVELAWQVRKEVLLDDLRQVVRRDPVFGAGGGEPAAVEWRFGQRHERVVSLTLDDGRRVRFAGRLDRVDRAEAGARVIDYKTGAGGAERQRIKDRLSVQLPVYQLAVRQWWREVGSGGREPAQVTSAYRLVTRRGGFDDVALPETEVEAQARLRALVTEALCLVDRGLFPRSRRDRCDYCDVAYACGVSGWARARKRKHPALAPVVGLQEPPSKDGTDG